MKYTLHRWEYEGTYLSFKNYKIFYKFSPKLNAQTILLIHGYPTSSFDWANIWDTLAENYQILAIDLLGLGFSDKPSKYIYS
ncbi:alpha/beta fold hydrolase, partial [Acinetobacter sp. ULE_I053]|uniref:alpha/beta fold hydrolase n=1 Tax=Acinetobacter sp. ULE_I053 TaxID=3373069 RepID=UPI003AF8295F